jgi:hypothetical protein
VIDLNKFLAGLVIAVLLGTVLYGLNRGFLNGYRLVQPGQVYPAPQHGEIHAQQPTLVCRYLSLGGTHTRVYLQSERYPECPFWLED